MSKIRVNLNYAVVATLVKGIRGNQPEKYIKALENVLDRAIQEEVKDERVVKR